MSIEKKNTEQPALCEHARHGWNIQMTSGTCQNCGAKLMLDEGKIVEQPAPVHERDAESNNNDK